MLRTPALLLVLSLAACHIHLRDGVTVDGVRLTHHHEEILSLETWPSEGLTIRSHQGDVRAEPGEGPTTIRVEVYERELGEAHAHLVDGRLEAKTTNGGPCAIGRVHLTVRGPVTGIELGTGMGDVELTGIEVEGRLALSTGMGDVNVSRAGKPHEIELSSGMGDVSAGGLHCARLEASTGMGDVSITDLEADEVELSSGMGDVDVSRSKGGRLQADTGMGDVELVESSFTTRALDSGLGRVRER